MVMPKCKQPNKAVPRLPRNEEDLEAAASHLAYEAARLFDAAKLYPCVCESGLEQLRLLVFEALLLHLRILLDFFFPVNPRETDVIVGDFLPNMPAVMQSSPEWLGAYRWRLNKLLAHLTYNRVGSVRSNQMEWSDLPKHLNDMKVFWSVFLDALPEHQRVWFNQKSS